MSKYNVVTDITRSHVIDTRFRVLMSIFNNHWTPDTEKTVDFMMQLSQEMFNSIMANSHWSTPFVLPEDVSERLAIHLAKPEPEEDEPDDDDDDFYEDDEDDEDDFHEFDTEECDD